MVPFFSRSLILVAIHRTVAFMQWNLWSYKGRREQTKTNPSNPIGIRHLFFQLNLWKGNKKSVTDFPLQCRSEGPDITFDGARVRTNCSLVSLQTADAILNDLLFSVWFNTSKKTTLNTEALEETSYGREDHLNKGPLYNANEFHQNTFIVKDHSLWSCTPCGLLTF